MVAALIDFARTERVSTLALSVHKTIYSGRFIWYEKAFLTCPIHLVSDENLLFAFSCRLTQHYTKDRDKFHSDEKSAEAQHYRYVKSDLD